MIEYEKVSVEKRKNICGGEREVLKHPAFGMISFNRMNGGDNTLFGSSINNNNKITLVIKRGEEERDLSKDWYHGRNKIIEVDMNYSQFAECITSLNVGDGVPCTIRYTEKDGYIPRIENNTSKREQFRNEFEEHITDAMAGVQKQIDEIQKYIDSKKNLGMKDKNEIVKSLTQVKYNIGCNLTFLTEQFDEQMDKTTQEAKGEIESFWQNKIMSIGTNNIVKEMDKINQNEENRIGIDIK